MTVRTIEARPNLGRRAGWLYLALVLIGPLRLIYIPAKLFVDGDAAETAANIASHESLFRLGMVGDVLCALLLVFLTLAFYRLFELVDPMLATLVVVLGGVMSAIIYFVNVARDAGALLIVHGAPFLAVFDASQRVRSPCCCSTSTLARTRQPRCFGASGCCRSPCSSTGHGSCRVPRRVARPQRNRLHRRQPDGAPHSGICGPCVRVRVARTARRARAHAVARHQRRTAVTI